MTENEVARVFLTVKPKLLLGFSSLGVYFEDTTRGRKREGEE